MAMRRYTAVLIVLILLLASSVSTLACGGDGGGPKSGQLPEIKTGDKWEYRNIQDGIEHLITFEAVQGDGSDNYYHVRMMMDPPLEGDISEAMAKFDKSQLLPVWMQMAGEIEGQTFSVEMETTYDVSDGSRWPMEVGKETVITETMVTTYKYGDETEIETESETKTYKVEAIEDVTVEAGTFECFRAAEYDENGNKLKDSWLSDEVKIFVKDIDYETGETQELVSYSVK